MPLTDEEIHALMRDRSQQLPCARHLGFELLDFSVDEGWAEMAFHPRAEFANPAGAVQSGFVGAMLDDAMSVAAGISQRFAMTVPTMQTTVTHLRPTPIERVMVRANVLRFGPASVVMQGALRGSDGTTLAAALSHAVPRPMPD